MAAVATKKPGSDRAVQLTFPLEFQKAYSMSLSFFQSDIGVEAPDIMVGTDFQANYHQQKRMDANKSVLNGLEARRTAELKMLTGHQNYHLPPPVLGQRKYANPSMGASEFSSARRDNGAEQAPFKVVEQGQMVGSGSGQLRGGIVSTQEGYQYVTDLRAKRIDQLNRMNSLAQGYAVPMGQSTTIVDEQKIGSVDKVTMFATLNALIQQVTFGTQKLSALDYEKIKDLYKSIFKYAPAAPLSDLEEILKGVMSVERSLGERISNIRDIGVSDMSTEDAETVLWGAGQMLIYLREMIRVANQYNFKDKQTLTRSLIKDLGFESINSRPAMRARLTELSNKFPQKWGGVDDDDDEWYPDDDDFDDGRFTREAETREDSEAPGMPRNPFAGRSGDPNRDKFGEKNGMIVFGGPSYFGEDTERDTQENLVAPLPFAGADPNATLPEPDTDTFKDEVEFAIKEILDPLKQAGDGADLSVEEQVARDFPIPSNFVDAVAKAVEDKGYTKAQVAKGMELTGLGIFSDYVSDNTGDLGPAPAAPARRFDPFAGAAAPVAPGFGMPGAADYGATPPGSTAPEPPARAAPSTKTKADFRAKYNTLEKIRAKAREAGLGYNPKAGTKIENAQNYLWNLLKGSE